MMKYILPWTRQASVDAYNRANLTVDDINVFENMTVLHQVNIWLFHVSYY